MGLQDNLQRKRTLRLYILLRFIIDLIKMDAIAVCITVTL